MLAWQRPSADITARKGNYLGRSSGWIAVGCDIVVNSCLRRCNSEFKYEIQNPTEDMAQLMVLLPPATAIDD